MFGVTGSSSRSKPSGPRGSGLTPYGGKAVGAGTVDGASKAVKRAIIQVNGVVQGVGFRPFVFRLAERFRLPGLVYNAMNGVVIEVEAPPAELERFYQAVLAEVPPLAQIVQHSMTIAEPKGYAGFEIRTSAQSDKPTVLVTPDVGICADCALEMADPADRRFGYPFINCTNCGPRFTIVRQLPYDRARTTMARFPMCPDCQREYDDPGHRRFHAQPNACPVCGPKAFFRSRAEVVGAVDGVGAPSIDEPESGESSDQAGVFARAREALAEGAILAVKGLGGFHLVCDARSEAAVRTLRERKHREAKPLAVMCADLSTVEQFCRVEPAHRDLLQSWRRPIVLLPKRSLEMGGGGGIAPSVAPGVDTLGVMLAYAPLHLLLFGDGLDCLVCTSANVSDSPLVIGNREAVTELSGIADFFLFHNRDIHNRCDDSVLSTAAGGPAVFRRSRGYAPQPLEHHSELKTLIAVGGDQKNTFCLTKDRRFYLSQHIGELGDVRSFAYFQEALDRLAGFFEIEPQAVVHDLHPDYRSTRLAREWFGARGLPLVAVQHHEAHLASCLAEHGVTDEVIGVVCDGTGYGSDGRLWGFEFFQGRLPRFSRVGHLMYTPMPGGEASIRRPSRMLASYLMQAGAEALERARSLAGAALWTDNELAALQTQIRAGLNAPETASAGRLFDAVSALAGVCRSGHYEGQPAIELEAAIHLTGAVVPREEAYPFEVVRTEAPSDAGAAAGWIIDHRLMWPALLEDLVRETDRAVLAARFHHTVSAMITRVVTALADEHGISRVALSGGVFQNRYLLNDVVQRLGDRGFEVFVPRKVPANDGGLSLGQAIIGDGALRGWAGNS